MVKAVKPQMRVLFIVAKDHISIIGLLATFKLACGNHRIDQRAEMWVSPHYFDETIVNRVNS